MNFPAERLEMRTPASLGGRTSSTGHQPLVDSSRPQPRRLDSRDIDLLQRHHRPKARFASAPPDASASVSARRVTQIDLYSYRLPSARFVLHRNFDRHGVREFHLVHCWLQAESEGIELQL